MNGYAEGEKRRKGQTEMLQKQKKLYSFIHSFILFAQCVPEKQVNV